MYEYLVRFVYSVILIYSEANTADFRCICVCACTYMCLHYSTYIEYVSYMYEYVLFALYRTLTANVPFPPTDASASHSPSMARLPVATSTIDSVKFPSTAAPVVAVEVVLKAAAFKSAAASLMTDLSAAESGKYPSSVVLLDGSVRAITDVGSPTSATTTTTTAAIAHKNALKRKRNGTVLLLLFLMTIVLPPPPLLSVAVGAAAFTLYRAASTPRVTNEVPRGIIIIQGDSNRILK